MCINNFFAYVCMGTCSPDEKGDCLSYGSTALELPAERQDTSIPAFGNFQKMLDWAFHFSSILFEVYIYSGYDEVCFGGERMNGANEHIQ